MSIVAQLWKENNRPNSGGQSHIWWHDQKLTFRGFTYCRGSVSRTMAFAFILSLFNLSALVYLFYIKHTDEGCQTGILLYESNSLDQAAATCNVFMIWGASESSEQICYSSGGFLFSDHVITARQGKCLGHPAWTWIQSAWDTVFSISFGLISRRSLSLLPA